MQIAWKQTVNSDGSEAIFGAFKTQSLEEASAKARQAVQIITSHRDDKYSHMSISVEGLTVMLHGVVKDKIEDDDWIIAKEIEQVLEVQS